MADKADITQSQACDTRHRPMQEVNSLCTDSGPLPVEYFVVGIPHNTAIKLSLESIRLSPGNKQQTSPKCAFLDLGCHNSTTITERRKFTTK